jgi:hypothetical protein
MKNSACKLILVDSENKQRGRGVFAIETIAKNYHITGFHGKHVSKEIMDASHSDKKVNIGGKRLIGYQVPVNKRGLAAFINSTNSGEKANCQLLYDKKTATIWVLKRPG